MVPDMRRGVASDGYMGRTIIVTGASRGIGLATSQALLAEGARVVTVQRTISAELKALEEKYPNTLRVEQGDCTDDIIIQRVIEVALDAFGAIHGLVFNAATLGGVGKIDGLPLEAWQRAFDTNVFGSVKFLRQALPVMAEDARVVFLSSIASGEAAFGAGGPYCASKAAVNSLNRTLAIEQPAKMHYDAAHQAKPYNRELMSGPDVVIEAELPARVIASLALRAPPKLSGKYIHWDDPALSAI